MKIVSFQMRFKHQEIADSSLATAKKDSHLSLSLCVCVSLSLTELSGSMWKWLGRLLELERMYLHTQTLVVLGVIVPTTMAVRKEQGKTRPGHELRSLRTPHSWQTGGYVVDTSESQDASCPVCPLGAGTSVPYSACAI